MNHFDYVRLIKRGITRPGGRWVDMGSGDGAFTLALRDIAGPDVEIVAIDLDIQALRQLSKAMSGRFPHTNIRTLQHDFTEPLDIDGLNGILTANALHYVPRHLQQAVLSRWREMLNVDGRLIIVEYDTDHGNRWVPFPFSFSTLGSIAEASGFDSPEQLNSHSSRFLGSMYAASLRPRFNPGT